jgi:ParB-like chromosome segregation protein Spo0J
MAKMFKIELVPIDQLLAWDKNPRERDPRRFDLVQLSLRKFGFVTPVFARKADNMLYSGHQRTGAAREIGYKEVPVCWVPDTDLDERTVNLVFNLVTNDHAKRSDFGQKLALDIDDAVSDVQLLPDATDLCPCVRWQTISPMDYFDQISAGKVNPQTKSFALEFTEVGVDIPVVIDRASNQILNGGPRLASALELGLVSYPAVFIDAHGDLLKRFLNQISMSFDLQKVFGESLRYNSFFRVRNQGAQRKVLGVGFHIWTFHKEHAKFGKVWMESHCTVLKGKDRDRWIARHGTTVIDFGAGRLDNTVKLQESGINCIPFEPFCLRPHSDEISYSSSRMIAINFLGWVSKRERLDSLFCSSVFNSVPFPEDREHMMTIFQALCCRGAKLFLLTLKDTSLKSTLFKNGDNKTSRMNRFIMLDSEPGTFVGSILTRPKVQKHHSREELIAQGNRYFHRTTYNSANGSSHGIECASSREIDPERLVRALEFEFDLPYPNNKRMGLQDKAIAAFSTYTDIDLVSVQKRLKQNV